MYDYDKEIGKIVNDIDAEKLANVYFVACGGSNATLSVGQYLFDRETTIPTFALNSNEFIHRSPKALADNSLVILCSHSGNTPETVAATTFAREKGATTVIFSNKPDSPLWQAGQHKLFYDWGPESKISNSIQGIFYRFLFSLLNKINKNDAYLEAVKFAGGELSDVVEQTITKFSEQAFAFGKDYKREKIIYTMSSGICYPVAYSYAICILQEMQWVHSAAIHSGEYFHGPFEITDYDVPFILIKGTGETRPMDERAHAFLKKYCEKIVLIDTAEFDMGSCPESMKGYFANIVAGALLRSYSDALAEHRGHPLSVRRYMWKMEY